MKQKPQDPPEDNDNTASASTASVAAATMFMDVMGEDNNDHDNHKDEEEDDAMEIEPIVQQEEQRQQPPKKSRMDPDGTHHGIQTNATTTNTTTTPTSVGTAAATATTTTVTHPTIAMRTKNKASTARDKRVAATSLEFQYFIKHTKKLSNTIYQVVPQGRRRLPPQPLSQPPNPPTLTLTLLTLEQHPRTRTSKGRMP